MRPTVKPGEPLTCKRCNRLFVSVGYELCPSCVAGEEREYKIVRDFLWEHPKSTVIEVMDATGVDEEKILRWLREGRLEVTEESGIRLPCLGCGKPINFGNFCRDCSKEFRSGTSVYVGKKKEETKNPEEKKERLYFSKDHDWTRGR